MSKRGVQCHTVTGRLWVALIRHWVGITVETHTHHSVLVDFLICLQSHSSCQMCWWNTAPEVISGVTRAIECTCVAFVAGASSHSLSRHSPLPSSCFTGIHFFLFIPFFHRRRQPWAFLMPLYWEALGGGWVGLRGDFLSIRRCFL